MQRGRHSLRLECLALILAVLAACRPAPARQGAPSLEAAGDLAELAEIAAERPLRAAFLILDGVFNTELTAPLDVLEHTRHHAPEGLGVEVFTVSPDGGGVTTAEGLRIAADYSFATAPIADILVVASAEGSRDEDLSDPELIAWVAQTGERSAVVMSLCWGAFVLAEAGLLDGAACTTFPADYDAFARRFPDLDLRINVSFVQSGKALTSQGGVRSFDAAMYLVDRLYGGKVAARVGAGLLIPWPPPDGSVSYLASD